MAKKHTTTKKADSAPSEEGDSKNWPEAVRQIIQHIFARCNIDLDVAPFLGRDFGEAAFHQRLAGRNDLDHGGMIVPEIALDGCR